MSSSVSEGLEPGIGRVVRGVIVGVTLYLVRPLGRLGPPDRWLSSSRNHPIDLARWVEAPGAYGRGARPCDPGREANRRFQQRAAMGCQELAQRPVNIGDDSLPAPSNPGHTGRCLTRKPNKIGVPYRFLLRAEKSYRQAGARRRIRTSRYCRPSPSSARRRRAHCKRWRWKPRPHPSTASANG